MKRSEGKKQTSFRAMMQSSESQHDLAMPRQTKASAANAMQASNGEIYKKELKKTPIAGQGLETAVVIVAHQSQRILFART